MEKFELVAQIKKEITMARYKSMSKVNKVLIQMYWNIGRHLVESGADKWGKSFIESVSMEIQHEYPGIKGFSVRNLWNMRVFYVDYMNHLKLQQLVGVIPWGHNLVIMSKIKDLKEREFYLSKCANNGWSRGVLVENIRFDLYSKSKTQQNNLDKLLKPNTVALYREQFRDEYNLSFLGLEDEHSEKELENQIVKNIVTVMKSLGSDYCFIGNQYPLSVDDSEYFVDLLFYHRKLRALIAIELKIDEFKPEYSQQLNWYLHLLDKKVRYRGENTSIGILICN